MSMSDEWMNKIWTIQVLEIGKKLYSNEKKSE